MLYMAHGRVRRKWLRFSPSDRVLARERKSRTACLLLGMLSAQHHNAHDSTRSRRCTKHKRNLSEPISPEDRSAALTEVFSPCSVPQSFRRSPDWTARSARLVAGTLGTILLLGIATLPATQPVTDAATVALRHHVALHQTVSSIVNLSDTERKWQTSWEALGFHLRLADDERCRHDVCGAMAMRARNPLARRNQLSLVHSERPASHLHVRHRSPT